MVPEESFEKNLSSAQRAAQALGFPMDRLGGMLQVRSALGSAPVDHEFDEATAAIFVGLKSKRRLTQLHKEERGPPFILKEVEHEGSKAVKAAAKTAVKAAAKADLSKSKPRMVKRRHYVHKDLRDWDQKRTRGAMPTRQPPTALQELTRLAAKFSKGDLSVLEELRTALLAWDGRVLGFGELHTLPSDELVRELMGGARLKPMSLKTALSIAWVDDSERSRWEGIYLGTLRNALAVSTRTVESHGKD